MRMRFACMEPVRGHHQMPSSEVTDSDKLSWGLRPLEEQPVKTLNS